MIAPLVEALTNEQSSATVRRLREILLSFGAAGKPYADSLRTSANPAVRRTAIELLRAFGGAEALPDLAALLNDSEPAVQREALRAIIQIGTDEAYAALLNAMRSGTTATRDVIMQVVGASRHERAAPLFVYILEHTELPRALGKRLCLRHRGARQSRERRRISRGPEAPAVSRRLVGAIPDRRLRAAAAPARCGRRLGSEQAHANDSDEATHGHAGRTPRVARAAHDARGNEAPPATHGDARLMETGQRLRFAEELFAVSQPPYAGRSLHTWPSRRPTKSGGVCGIRSRNSSPIDPSIAIGLIDQEIVVGDTPLSKTENYAELISRLQALGIERFAFDRGSRAAGTVDLVLTIAHPERKPGDGAAGRLPPMSQRRCTSSAAHQGRSHHPRRARQHIIGGCRHHPAPVQRGRQRGSAPVGYRGTMRTCRSRRGPRAR